MGVSIKVLYTNRTWMHHNKSIKKSNFLFTVLIACLVSFQFSALGNSVEFGPVELRCEYLINPLGVDEKNPRLSWKVKDDSQGALQTAYQIIVSTDSTFLKNGIKHVWNSGKVLSSATLINYAGKPLTSGTRYYWTVKVWNKIGQPYPLPSKSFFETGIGSVQWSGSWISDGEGVEVKHAPYFRTQFNASKKIKNARVYLAAAGLYELYINGNKIGNQRLDPTYTRFDRRVLYVTHDITASVTAGKNAIGVVLGNGWYNHQSTAVWNFHDAPWRARPTFCMDLKLTYEDGSAEIISTGKNWRTNKGPIVFNSIYTAEHFDATQDITGWNLPQYDDKDWKEVIYRTAPTQQIVSQQLHPIRNVEEIKSKSINKLNDTVFVFDLGRNISGVSKITVSGPKGTQLKLKHGERLYANGKVDMSNIDLHYRPTGLNDPFQTDIITLSGKGEETFMPHFNYKGFQYVEVTSSAPVNLIKESLIGYFMHSDVPVAGQITSSDPVINGIWKAANNSYLSNLFGYPTDCPQREKNGWTGDAHIAMETGLYNFDAITIYEKWMADHKDEQQPNGVLPSIIPTGGWGYEWGNGPDWTSTIAHVPWNLFLFYGDKKMLSTYYENIRRYVDHIHELFPSGLTTWGLGDWVPVKSKSPVEYTSSGYYLTDVRILAKAAKILKKESDYLKYTALSNHIQNAINKKYLDRAKAIYGKGTQTEMSFALHWNIVPEEIKRKVAANLAHRVEQDSFSLDVGLLGTKTILNALSDNGYAEAAYKLASKRTYPSWGWWIVNGATTLYENWQIDAKNDISLNHIMFGEIGAWFYKALGGIKPDENLPGFKHILLKPHFVSGLDSLNASFNGPQGLIVSSWKRVDKNVEYTVAIPPNSTATLSLNLPPGSSINQTSKPVLPNATMKKNIHHTKDIHLQAGTYQFIIYKVPS